MVAPHTSKPLVVLRKGLTAAEKEREEAFKSARD
jgi:hypothetical protein